MNSTPLIAFLSILLASSAFAEFALPPEIAAGIAKSSIGESGGFGVRGVDENIYQNYIRSHWREIVENLESLPLAQSSYSDQPVKNRQIAINISAANFCASCEVLPPDEYLEFLNQWLDAYEQGRIQFPAVRWIYGLKQKRDFLSYNWRHPKVREIVKRALELSPPKETSWNEMMTSISKGEMAESYLYLWSKGDRLPERPSKIDQQHPSRRNQKTGTSAETQHDQKKPLIIRSPSSLVVVGALVVILTIVAIKKRSSS